MAFINEMRVDMLVRLLVLLWAIGAFVTLPWGYTSLVKLSHEINKTLAENNAGKALVNSLVIDDEQCAVTYDPKTKQLKTSTPDAGQCITCKNATDLVNDAFYPHEGFVMNPKYAGQMLEGISEVTNWTECSVNPLPQVSNDLNRISALFQEFYVMEKTKVALLVSTILFYVGVLFTVAVTAVRVFTSYRLEWADYSVTHWIYTCSIFLSLFAFIIAFCMSLTREFWASSYTKIGMFFSHDFYVTTSTTLSPVDQFTHINVPTFDDYDQSYLTTFEGLMVSALVFQILSFAGHFTLKYGPLVRNLDAIVEKVSTGSKAASKASSKAMYASKTAAKIQYAPLVSVARA